MPVESCNGMSGLEQAMQRKCRSKKRDQQTLNGLRKEFSVGVWNWNLSMREAKVETFEGSTIRDINDSDVVTVLCLELVDRCPATHRPDIIHQSSGQSSSCLLLLLSKEGMQVGHKPPSSKEDAFVLVLERLSSLALLGWRAVPLPGVGGGRRGRGGGQRG